MEPAKNHWTVPNRKSVLLLIKKVSNYVCESGLVRELMKRVVQHDLYRFGAIDTDMRTLLIGS